MSEPRPGFQRDVKAVVDAFNAGLKFDPPVIHPSEFRESLRMVGLPLDEDKDDLQTPDFALPLLDYEDDGDDPEEETDHGD